MLALLQNFYSINNLVATHCIVKGECKFNKVVTSAKTFSFVLIFLRCGCYQILDQYFFHELAFYIKL